MQTGPESNRRTREEGAGSKPKTIAIAGTGTDSAADSMYPPVPTPTADQVYTTRKIEQANLN